MLFSVDAVLQIQQKAHYWYALITDQVSFFFSLYLPRQQLLLTFPLSLAAKVSLAPPPMCGMAMGLFGAAKARTYGLQVLRRARLMTAAQKATHVQR